MKNLHISTTNCLAERIVALAIPSFSSVEIQNTLHNNDVYCLCKNVSVYMYVCAKFCKLLRLLGNAIFFFSLQILKQHLIESEHSRI